MTQKVGILLANLGSPDSTSVDDVRKYLDEFLMDERVIDINPIFRALLVKGIILRKRPAESAEAYKQIWTDRGSPLIWLSQDLAEAVKAKIELPLELVMRYGSISIRKGLEKLKAQQVTTVRLLPLYPHYAISSYETVVVKVKEEMHKLGMGEVKLEILPPFYQHPDYIEAMVANAQEYLDWDYDHLLFSYHGIPVRHLVKGDPGFNHCQKVENCCDVPSPAHGYCYRHQAFETTRAFVEKAGIPADKYSVSFQSRLGRTPWLQPYTDFELEKFPQQGIKKLLVICPSFVSDCLETLEEIQMRGKESFEGAGGEELRQIPCLNTHPDWIQTVAKWCQDDTMYQAQALDKKQEVRLPVLT